MGKRLSGGTLTPLEKRIVKALLAKGENNQDIHALINLHRPKTVNFGRISGVKKDANQAAATDEELEFYHIRKRAYDPATGLNRYDDERLIRARESMILAVQIFNSAGLKFKTEVFTMLANVAWTYLMHEHYLRKGNEILEEDGKAWALSYMLKRDDCPLSKGIKQNLETLKALRDRVEHQLLGKADVKWLGMFQACCLNFDKTIRELFGDALTLGSELSIALQFGKMKSDQVLAGNKFEVPETIDAIDALLTKDMTEEELADTEFQFRTAYSLESASKGKAHIHFVGSKDEAADVKNVLVKKVSGDELYPHKPKKVVALVQAKAGAKFNMNDFISEAKAKKIRPYPKGNKPEKTDKTYCTYHKAHGDYTYSDTWVEYLIDQYAPKPATAPEAAKPAANAPIDA